MAGNVVFDPLSRLSDRQVFMGLAAMTVLALLAALWTMCGVNPLRGDTFEYLYFDHSRTVGYPAFLALVRLITGQVTPAVPAQMLLLAGSFLILGWSFYRFGGRPTFSFVFQAIVLSLPAAWYASAFLMTEAISTALIALWCAQLLHMINQREANLRGAISLVAVSGLATMVRPAFVPLFFGSAIFMMVAHPSRERWRALILAGAGLILAWGATPIAQLLVHGSTNSTSPLARGVLQHTLFCTPDAVPNHADALFVEQSSAPVRRYIETATPEMQQQLRRSYSTVLRFALIIPVLGHRHDLDTRSQVDPYLSRIAIERVKANPSCCARRVAEEYLRMATFSSDPTNEAARRLNAFMKTHPPVVVPQYPRLPREEQLRDQAAKDVHQLQHPSIQPSSQNFEDVGKGPFLAILPLQIIFGGASLLGLLSLLALPFRRRLRPQLQEIVPAMAAMGGAIHGTLAITALVEIGFWRYLAPLWPIVCTIGAVAVVGLMRGTLDRLSGKPTDRLDLTEHR